MTDSLSLTAALLLGLLGSAHCIGMCGGIAASLALSEHPDRSLHLLAYNLGRLCSYALAGALLGGAGILVKGELVSLLLRSLAGLLLIAMGLYVAQWWKGLTHVEQLGSRLWALIRPAAGRLLPVRHLSQALLLGIFWGWLPCGLVYSTLIWAATSQAPLHSAMLMFTFGIGTLPAMLTTGLLARQVQQLLARRSVQSIAGSLIILFGLYTLPINALLGA